jgi:PRC-barrel domain
VRRSITVMAGAAILAGGLAGPAMAQGAPQTVALVKVDPQTVATGFRSSKVVGSSVVNEANETVGAIDDLIVTPEERVPYAISSVGGFLGVGTKICGRAVQFAADAGQEDRAARCDQGRAESAPGIQIQELKLCGSVFATMGSGGARGGTGGGAGSSSSGSGTTGSGASGDGGGSWGGGLSD